jgi:hypothetical protein
MVRYYFADDGDVETGVEACVTRIPRYGNLFWPYDISPRLRAALYSRVAHISGFLAWSLTLEGDQRDVGRLPWILDE